MEKTKIIKGNSVYRIMPIIMRKVVFTKKDIIEESGVSRNIVSKIIDNLVELKILVEDTNYMKKGYKYKSIYNVFAENN